jgi:RNA polymerase sigma-70 factor (ECF subfamily)
VVRDQGEKKSVADQGESTGLLSFEPFFEAQHVRLFGTICVITGDPKEAEELMQEAFLKVWERWDRVSSYQDPAGYLYRTAFNLLRNRHRRMMRAARHPILSATAEDAFARVDEREALLGALRRLTRRQRAAIVLTELMDLTSEEASQLLGVKPGSVRALASQARASLRKSLEGDGE